MIPPPASFEYTGWRPCSPRETRSAGQTPAEASEQSVVTRAAVVVHVRRADAEERRRQDGESVGPDPTERPRRDSSRAVRIRDPTTPRSEPFRRRSTIRVTYTTVEVRGSSTETPCYRCCTTRRSLETVWNTRRQFITPSAVPPRFEHRGHPVDIRGSDSRYRLPQIHFERSPSAGQTRRRRSTGVGGPRRVADSTPTRWLVSLDSFDRVSLRTSVSVDPPASRLCVLRDDTSPRVFVVGPDTQVGDRPMIERE